MVSFLNVSVKPVMSTESTVILFFSMEVQEDSISKIFCSQISKPFNALCPKKGHTYLKKPCRFSFWFDQVCMIYSWTPGAFPKSTANFN